jgi:hypothetical protein
MQFTDRRVGVCGDDGERARHRGDQPLEPFPEPGECGPLMCPIA